jgi:hypothetical protein
MTRSGLPSIRIAAHSSHSGAHIGSCTHQTESAVGTVCARQGMPLPEFRYLQTGAVHRIPLPLHKLHTELSAQGARTKSPEYTRCSHVGSV